MADLRETVWESIADRQRTMLVGIGVRVEQGTCDACACDGPVVARDDEDMRVCVVCALAIFGANAYVAGVDDGVRAAHAMSDALAGDARATASGDIAGAVRADLGYL